MGLVYYGTSKIHKAIHYYKKALKIDNNLKKGWYHDYFGTPDIYTVGTVGRIKEHYRLSDGTYNIILEGLYRFKILGENHQHAYREADVKLLPSKPLPVKDETVEQEKKALIQVFTQFLQEVHEREIPDDIISPDMAYDELVNLTSQLLDHLMSRKQRLLEEDDIRQRGRILKRLIENRLLQYRLDQVLDTEYEGSIFN